MQYSLSKEKMLIIWETHLSQELASFSSIWPQRSGQQFPRSGEAVMA
jgi:hypothetical protein